MGFEESALARLRRYREEADVSLELIREAEEAARHFSSRLFAGLEYTAVLGRQAGFEIDTTYAGGALDLRAVAGSGREAGVSFGVVPGAAAETDEDLMHEELSRYSLEPSGSPRTTRSTPQPWARPSAPCYSAICMWGRV